MFSRYRLWDLNIRSTTNLVNIVRQYAFKSDLKIKWVRPQKVLCYKPEKSGDLAGNKPVDKSLLLLPFRNSKELETADDTVRKLFTLEFAPRWRITQAVIHENVSSVQRHSMDFGSPEAKIAKWTGCIRSQQEIMERFPRNKFIKVRLKELIDKRKKHLKYLRKWDYKRFEWLLEKLNLFYRPVPTEWHKITRKDSLRRLTDLHCENLRSDKLNEYRKILEAEQPAFLEEKIRTLEHIRNEQKECNVPVTITQEEIDETKKQLVDLLMKQKESTT